MTQRTPSYEVVFPLDTTKLSIDIRLSTTKDLPFIHDSWLKTSKYQYPNQYALDFSKHYQEYMQKIIDNSIILVAHLKDEPDELVSYLVYTSFKQNQIIHFAYTKVDGRGQGIINQLIQFSNPEKLPIVFTHAAKNEHVMQNLTKKYIFDPSLLVLKP